MTILLALFAALIGACVCAVGLMLAYILFFHAVGADSQQGAIEMGSVAMLPVGAIIGAVLGLWLVLRLRGRQRAAALAGHIETGGAPEDFMWSERIPLPVWALLAAMVAAAGAWAWWLFDDGSAWEVRGEPMILISEIRTRTDDPDIAAAIKRRSDLGSQNRFHTSESLEVVETDGEYTILRERHKLRYRTTERSVNLSIGDARKLVFLLDLPKRPQAQEAFTEWRPVDEIGANFYGRVFVPEGGHDYAIRTRVLAPGQ